MRRYAPVFGVVLVLLMVAASAGRGQDRAPREEPQANRPEAVEWQYTSFEAADFNTGVNQLNNLGNQGWELVSAFETERPGPTIIKRRVFYMKRLVVARRVTRDR